MRHFFKLSQFTSIVLCSLGINDAFCQKWDSVHDGKFYWPDAISVMYTDTINNYMYVAGYINKVGNKHIQGIARWNGSQWDSLGWGIDGINYCTGNYYPQNTWAMAYYNGKLYVGGGFSSLGKVKASYIGTWDGFTWDSIIIQPFKNNSIAAVEAMEPINNKLYISGDFDTIAGFPCIGIAQWDGSNWSSLNFPNIKDFYDVSSICEYNGSIYTAGLFDNTLNDTISNILRWDGTNWYSVAGGIKGSGFTDILSMAVYKGDLYVAGDFSKSNGNAGNNIQKWNGTSWSDVGGGTGGVNGQIRQLLVFNNKLYAVGVFTTAGGIPASKIAEWDGTQWCGLGSIFNSTIGSICSYKDTLYVGGGFYTINGDSISYLAKWVGGNYVDTCGAIIASVNQVKENKSISVYPNPNNGRFTISLYGVSEKTQIKVKVYDILGQEVYHAKLNATNTQIDLGNKAEGLYLYRVLTEIGDLVSEGKIIKE